MPQNKEYIKKDSINNFFAERLNIPKDRHMKEYIERKEALRQIFLEAMGHNFDFNAEYMEIFMSAKRAIRNTPAADVVEVRHAKWDDNHKCTACGNEALLEEKPDTMAHGLNSLFFVDSDYCPHCGALMDKEK